MSTKILQLPSGHFYIICYGATKRVVLQCAHVKLDNTCQAEICGPLTTYSRFENKNKKSEKRNIYSSTALHTKMARSVAEFSQRHALEAPAAFPTPLPRLPNPALCLLCAVRRLSLIHI